MAPDREITREQVMIALSNLPPAGEDLAHRKLIVLRTAAGKRIELMAYRVRATSHGNAYWAWQCEFGDETLIWPIPT